MIRLADFGGNLPQLATPYYLLREQTVVLLFGGMNYGGNEPLHAGENRLIPLDRGWHRWRTTGPRPNYHECG